MVRSRAALRRFRSWTTDHHRPHRLPCCGATAEHVPMRRATLDRLTRVVRIVRAVATGRQPEEARHSLRVGAMPEATDVDAADKPDGIAWCGHRVMTADPTRIVV